MATLSLKTVDDQTRFLPGDEIVGRAAWRLDGPPESAEVRLFWYTEGKGTRDVGVVSTVRLDAPAPEDQRDFRFTLPSGPYSFSGKLVSVLWALELVVEPGRLAERLGITVSPTGSEVLL